MLKKLLNMIFDLTTFSNVKSAYGYGTKKKRGNKTNKNNT